MRAWPFAVVETKSARQACGAELRAWSGGSSAPAATQSPET